MWLLILCRENCIRNTLWKQWRFMKFQNHWIFLHCIHYGKWKIICFILYMKIYHVDNVQIKNLIYNKYALIESKSFNESFGSSPTILVKKTTWLTGPPPILLQIIFHIVIIIVIWMQELSSNDINTKQIHNQNLDI